MAHAKSSGPSIEGAFALEVEYAGDVAKRSPDVDGRFVMVDGLMLLVVCDRGRPGPDDDTHVSQYGSYSIVGEAFSYSWQYRVKCLQGKTETTSSTALSFEGQRHFNIERLSNETRLFSSSPNAEFRFKPDRLEYLESGKLVRVWRRLQDSSFGALA